MQRSIRFPPELAAKIEARAAAEDRSFSYVVLRALESALSNEASGVDEGEPRPEYNSSPHRAAPSRTPESPPHAELMAERQRRLNAKR